MGEYVNEFDDLPEGAKVVSTPSVEPAYSDLPTGATVVISPESASKSSMIRRTVGDMAARFGQGLIGIPEAAVGIADVGAGPLAQVATGMAKGPMGLIDVALGSRGIIKEKIAQKGSVGAIGKSLQKIGINFSAAKEAVGSLLTPEFKESKAEVDKAEGFVDNVVAYATHPDVAAGLISESAPGMLAGAGIGRKLISVFPKLSPVVASAIGEGLISMQGVEGMRQRSESGMLTTGQAALGTGSSAITSLLSVLGGKMASKLGFEDLDVLLAKGGGSVKEKKNIFLRILGGMATEYGLEELPQSTQEQIAQNLAEGKPWSEGVGKSAAAALFPALGMGGAANIPGPIRGVNVKPTTEGVKAWATENPDAARKLAAAPDPTSRKAATEAGLPQMNKENRTAFAEALKTVEIPAAQPPPVPVQPPPVPAVAPISPEPISEPVQSAIDEKQALQDIQAGIPGVVEGRELTPEEAARLEELSVTVPIGSPADLAIKENPDKWVVADKDGENIVVFDTEEEARAHANKTPEPDVVAQPQEEGVKNAIQEPSAAQVDVGERPQNGAEMGKPYTEGAVAEEGRPEGVAPEEVLKPTEKVASVPLMMTRKMREDLANRGFTPDQIANMKPEEAGKILSKKISAKKIKPVPQELPGTEVPINLAGQEGVDGARVMREKETEAKKQAEFEARQQELVPVVAKKPKARRVPIEEAKDNARKALIGRLRRPKKGEKWHKELEGINRKYFAKAGAPRSLSLPDAVNEARGYEGAIPEGMGDEDAINHLLRGKLIAEAEAINKEKRDLDDRAKRDLIGKFVAALKNTDEEGFVPPEEIEKHPAEYKAALKQYQDDLIRQTEGRDYGDVPISVKGLTGIKGVIGAAAAVNVPGESGVIGKIFSGTGTKNDYTKEMQKRLGKATTEVEAKSDEELLNQVNEVVQQNGSIGSELVARMKSDPFIPTDVERLIFLREALLRENALNSAVERGDKSAADFADKALNELYDATQEGSRQWGRSGRAMQMMMDEDFSVGRLTWRRRKLSGRELTPDEKAEIALQAKEYADKKKAFEDKLAKIEAENAGLKGKLAEKESEEASQKASEAELQKIIGEVARIEAERDAAMQELQSVKGSYDGLRDLFKKASEGTGRNRIFTEERGRKIENAANAARERMRMRAYRFSANPIDPAVLVDIVEIGAEFIYKGAAFAESMIREFGNSIKPHLPDIEKLSLELLERQAKEDIRKPEPKKAERQSNARQKAKRGGVTVRQLVRDQVEAKERDLEKILENVQTIIREAGGLAGLNADPTIREIRDAFSGYGKPLEPSRDEIDVTMARLRTKSQKLSQLEDIVKHRIPPKKSGRQRLESTPEERELGRKVRKEFKDLMRELGIKEEKSPAQMKSAAEAVNTRMRNAIEDLERAMATGERIAKARGEVSLNEEGKALKAHLEDMRAEYASIFGKEQISPEEQMELAERAAERNAEFWEKRLAKVQSGEKVGQRRVSSPWSPTISEAKKRVSDAKQAIQAIEDALNPPLTETMKEIKKVWDRTQLLIKKGEAKIAAGDFGPKPYKRPLNLSDHPDLMALKQKYEEVKLRIKAGEAKARFDDMSPTEKATYLFSAGWDVARNTAGSMDLSALGRQGWFYMLTHPIQWAKSFESVKAISKEASRDAYQKHLERKNHLNGLDDVMKIAFNKADGTGNFTSAEDNFRLDLARKIAILGLGIDASNRLYATAINQMRAGFADLLMNNSEMGREIMKNPRNLTEDQRQFLRDIGQGVNILTGRSDLKGAETWAKFGWAPRFVMSSIDFLRFKPIYASKSKAAKVMFAKEYARLAGTMLAIYGMAALMRGDDDDDKVDWDPRSSSFGAIKIWGNHYWNPLAVIKPQLVFLARLISGQTKVGQKVSNLRNSNLFFATEEQKAEKVAFGREMGGTIGRFLQSKLHPTLGAALGLATGKTFSGKDATLTRLLTDAATPLTPRAAWESFRTTDPATATSVTAMEALGLGVDPDYNDFKVARYQAENEKEFKKKLTNMDIERSKKMFDSATEEERNVLRPYLEKKLGNLIWSATDAESKPFDKDAFAKEVRKLANGGPVTPELRDMARANLAERATKENASLMKKRAEAIAEIEGMTEDEAVSLMRRYVVGKGDIPRVSSGGKLTPYGQRVMRLRRLYREKNENTF